jgi:hypothetical protein
MKEKTKSEQGRSSRLKGKRGELELVHELKDLLGIDLRRRVRNSTLESDITGLDGFSVEVKNQDALSVRAWWRQTVSQSALTNEIPVLFYKVPRKGFRAVVSVSKLFEAPVSDDLDYTAEMSLTAFAMYFREMIK